MDSIVHERMKEKVFALYDGELSEAERQAVQQHLEACPDCRETYNRWVKIAGTFLRAPELPASEALVRRVMERVEVIHQPIGIWPQSVVFRWLVPVLGVGMAASLLMVTLPRSNVPVSTETLLMVNGTESVSSEWMFLREAPGEDDVLGFALERP